MFRNSILAVLIAFAFSGVVSATSLIDFQEQFVQVSEGVRPQLQILHYLNNDERSRLIGRMLDGLGNLTVEMRNITWEYWARIEAHEAINEDCIEYVRGDFNFYVWYGGLDIQYLADDLDEFMRMDAKDRFNPIASMALRENTRAIYQTVQTLGRNQFVDNLSDTVEELEDELTYYRNLWTSNREMLQQEIAYIEELWEKVEQEIEWWHEFTVRWHRYFMNSVYEDVEYWCSD